MLRVLLVELAWLCLLVSLQIAGGVELPGKKANSRFEGVSALRLSVGSAAGEHKFMDSATSRLGPAFCALLLIPHFLYMNSTGLGTDSGNPHNFHQVETRRINTKP